MKTTLKFVLAGSLVAGSVALAFAQQAQTVRLRGTIEKVDGNTLTLKTRDGEAKLSLTGDARVVAVVKATMAEVKEGTFLGSAAMPQPDGTQKALEVHIFPEQMRGTGEGHRPYAPVPNSTMTNGTASGATVAGVDGSTIILKFKDGEKKIVVPPTATIAMFGPGEKAEVKPGVAVAITAVAKPDGSFETGRVGVGRDGFVPN
jgi:hypothetical protein